jgi:IclR family transcriptional regulator, pca regulon regulatory protein
VSTPQTLASTRQHAVGFTSNQPPMRPNARSVSAKKDTALPSPAPLKRDLVAGVEKGLSVIAAFDRDRPQMTISEVASHCDLTRAAARRYLITLRHLGFVTNDGKQFSLTAKVLRLAQSYMQSARLPHSVQPELHRLAYMLKESSAAGVLDGDDVLCVAALSVGRVVSSTLQPGTRVPAYCTANGRMLLSALPVAELHAWVARQSLVALTPHTITQPKKLIDEIARVRVQAYAAVDQELELGLRTLSVPLMNSRGEAVAALNVSVHAARMSMTQLIEDCLPSLRHAQTQLKLVL